MTPSLLERWLIDNAVENGRPLPRWLRARVDRSAELQRYLAALSRVDAALGEREAAPVAAPGRGLSMRIADALAQAGGRSRRSMPPGWLSGALVTAALIVGAVFLAQRGPKNVQPTRTPVAGRLVPLEFRGHPITKLVTSVEGPLNQRWNALSVDTRRSVSDFIRGLPGLPVGEHAPERLN